MFEICDAGRCSNFQRSLFGIENCLFQANIIVTVLQNNRQHLFLLLNGRLILIFGLAQI